MALNVAVIDGMTSSTAGDLTSLLSSLLSQEGVVITDGTDLDVTQADTPALSVEVKAGTCFVTNDGFTKNNGEVKHWHVTVTADEEVSVDSNSSGSTRIDAICVKVDTAVTPDSTASNVATLVAVKGTPGAGNPVIPDNHLLLAYISVEDSETQILDADITDSRQYFGVALPHTSGLRLQDTGGAVDAQLYEDTTGDIYLVGSKSGGGIRIRQATGAVQKRDSHTQDWGAMGAMSDEGAYVKPISDGDSIRAYDNAGGSDYAELDHDGTDAKLNSGAGHIVLTPASSKLVKVAVLEQNAAGTNTYRNNAVILTGWGTMVGGTNSGLFNNEGVSFGITFTTVPMVLISFAGRDITGTKPTTLEAHTEYPGYLSNHVYAITTAGFTAAYSVSAKGDVSGALSSAGAYYAYCWIAIGTLS